jgi:type III pantothenate kinase
MLFCLDIGNTIITFGVFDGDTLAHHWRVSTDVHRTAEEYAALFDSLFRLESINFRDIQAACMVSVDPTITGTVIELFQRYWKIAPLVVDAGVRTGVRVRTENPREVGADRIVNAAAAYRLYGGPACVVDFSTATSFDAVSGEGDYLGGAIAPGFGIALEALSDRAAKLPKIEIARPPHAIGRNTIQSMQSGFLYGIIGLVEGMVTRFRCELGDEMRVIATGSLAEVIARETNAIQILAPWLTLEGLRLVFSLNRPGSMG